MFRTSGLPVDPAHLESFKTELYEANETLKKEIGEFEKLSSIDQGTYQRRLEEIEQELFDKYPKEANWDIDLFKSKRTLKKLVNQYGVVAFGKDHDTKSLAVFIIDSKF